MALLILTNGDSASDLLKAAGKDGRVEPWRDCLHEGPLLPLTCLSDEITFRQARARFLSERQWADYDSCLAGFEARDGLLDDLEAFEGVELWFEHDLYDQLQLIDILTRLYHRGYFENVTLIQAERYLGMMSPEAILDLEGLSRPVPEQMMAIADLAFQCVTHETPAKLVEFVTLKPAGFLFLTQALIRLLEELPGRDGLSRTERQILYSLHRGIERPGMLFARSQAMEEAQFWGDWGFFSVLSSLQDCPSPLIEGLPASFSPALFANSEARKAFLQSKLCLTALGAEVLARNADHATHNPIERYVGGTLVTNEALWRWDQEIGKLLPPA